MFKSNAQPWSGFKTIALVGVAAVSLSAASLTSIEPAQARGFGGGVFMRGGHGFGGFRGGYGGFRGGYGGYGFRRGYGGYGYGLAGLGLGLGLAYGNPYYCGYGYGYPYACGPYGYY